MATQENTAAWLRVGVYLEEMKWADLRAFVRFCEHIPDDAEVGMDVDHGGDVIGLTEVVRIEGPAE